MLRAKKRQRDQDENEAAGGFGAEMPQEVIGDGMNMDDE